MAKRRSGGSRYDPVSVLAEAPLCVEEQYYHALAQPLMRRGAQKRARDLAALVGPLLALGCALFIGVSLALTTPARIRSASLLAPLLARFAGAPLGLAVALAAAAPVLAALLLMSLWARLDLMRERRVRATLEAKLRLAHGYRDYLLGLVALTEPMAWARPMSADAADVEDTGPAVLVALSVSHDARWDEERPPMRAARDAGVGDGSVSRPIARFGWDASVEAARRDLPQMQTVETVAQALAQTPSGAIILCGGAGAGKTTLMRYVAQAQAQAQLRLTRPGGRLPLYADMAWLEGAWPTAEAQPGQAVEVALASLAQRISGVEPAVARDLAHALAQAPALLLFDELDTLPSEQRDQVASSLAAFLAERRPAHTAAESAAAWPTQVVIGARDYQGPLGDGPAYARFQRWELEPLAYPMGRLALLRGALAQRRGSASTAETPASDVAAEALLRTLATPWTETWLTQPLSLALAAVAHAEAPTVTPYRSRSDLYTAAVGALLRAQTPGWSDEERGALRQLADELALWLRQRGLRAFSPATAELDQWLLRLPAARIVAVRAGVTSPSQAVATLSGLCEVGPGGLACFSLDVFHSVLAGAALARALADAAPSRLASTATLPATALALTWERRVSARWSDTLVFMCGALCSPTVARGDLAVAWLRAVLAQRDELEEPGLLLAGVCLPALRGDPQGASLATDIAARLHLTLLRRGPEMTRGALALAHRACSEAMADPVARQVLIDLLRAQLLDGDAQASRQAAQTFGALGQAGVSVAPMLTGLLRATIWMPRAAVARAIGALGPAYGAEAIPALLASLDDHTPVVRAAVLAALGAVAPEPDDALIRALLAGLDDHDGAVRTAAATALGKVGALETEGEPLVEALIQPLSDTESDAQVAAALALGSIPATAEQVPALIEALAAIGWSDRAASALTLGALGQAATPALPALLTLSREDTVVVRTTTARALAQIGPQRADVVEALVERLGDEASETRKAAAEALAQMDAALPELRAQAWPALLAALYDPREGVRWAAGRALDTLGAVSDPKVVATLFALLDDPRGYVRAAAALPLEALDVTAARSLPARIANLPTLRDEVCLVAVEALGMLGVAHKASASSLAALLDDPRWEIRRAALRTLRRIGPRRATILQSLARVADPEAHVRLEAIATLAPLDRHRDDLMCQALQRRLLEDDDSSVRAAAATALGRLGPGAASALPILLRALDDGAAEVQRATALAIGALRLPQASVMPQLTAQLSDPAPGARGAIALALGALGPDAASAVTPELLILLRDEVSLTRAGAAEALGMLGPSAGASARAALLQRLDDADTETRAAAAEALGRLGAGDDDPWTLIDALIRRSHDLRYAVRRAAVFALMLFGPIAVRAALPRLLALLGDTEDSTRRAVVAALATLDAEGEAEALPWLLQALGAVSADERASAALALAAMRPALDEAERGTLARLLDDREGVVRAAAAQAVGAMSETAFREGPPAGLGALLGDERWQARAAAAQALGHFGARVGPADRGALRAALADADETTRQAAAQALGQADATGAGTLAGELLSLAKTRSATGALAPLAQRRALEVYAAMARPSWVIVEQVGALLSDETYWAIQRDACALIERWRYASTPARRRLRWLGERASHPATRAAAHAALRASLVDSPDLDLTSPAEISDQRDNAPVAVASPSGAVANTPSGLRPASQSRMSSASGVLPTIASAASGELALRIGGDEGRSA